MFFGYWNQSHVTALNTTFALGQPSYCMGSAVRRKFSWGFHGLQKVLRWLLDADDNLDSHQNIIITFWPNYNVAWTSHANLFRVICIKSTN